MTGELDAWTVALRLGAGIAGGGLLGFEREWKNKPAGLRTHMIVGLASAAFTILTLDLYGAIREVAPDTNADPLRIIGAVVSGIAFLGAGSIIQARGRIEGVTTGATLWLAGAVGLACGAGFFGFAAVCTVLGLLVLIVMKGIEQWIGDE